MVAATHRTEYLPLDEIPVALVNPKLHSDAEIRASLRRFGYVEPGLIDDRTGRLVAGHGRLAALQAMRADSDPPPAGIEVRADGAWLVPVTRGWASSSDMEAHAVGVALNRLTEAGGWDNEALAELLEDFAGGEHGFDGLGFGGGDLDEILAGLAPAVEPEPAENYSRKIQAPVYEPTGVCPAVADLYDPGPAVSLRAEIDQADLPDDVRAFLAAAADRHIRFRFDRIAEFYAHADAGVQDLMERSALVIVDFDRAVELGFVKLTDRLAAGYAENLALTDPTGDEAGL